MQLNFTTTPVNGRNNMYAHSTLSMCIMEEQISILSKFGIDCGVLRVKKGESSDIYEHFSSENHPSDLNYGTVTDNNTTDDEIDFMMERVFIGDKANTDREVSNDKLDELVRVKSSHLDLRRK